MGRKRNPIRTIYEKQIEEAKKKRKKARELIEKWKFW